MGALLSGDVDAAPIPVFVATGAQRRSKGRDGQPCFTSGGGVRGLAMGAGMDGEEVFFMSPDPVRRT